MFFRRLKAAKQRNSDFSLSRTGMVTINTRLTNDTRYPGIFTCLQALYLRNLNTPYFLLSSHFPEASPNSFSVLPATQTTSKHQVRSPILAYLFSTLKLCYTLALSAMAASAVRFVAPLRSALSVPRFRASSALRYAAQPNVRRAFSQSSLRTYNWRAR